MKTIKEIAQELLLEGEHLNKGDFHAKYKTFTLTQRIEEIRKDGWNVKSKTIPGRKGMVEYWLEPEEIHRLHAHGRQVIEALTIAQEESKKLAEGTKQASDSEAEAYEQTSLLMGGSNYTKRW